jgi:hypothetical protein
MILRTTDELQTKILPIAACGGKLLSFTRKLYRWGFRQARSKYDNEKIFCHPLFHRDDKCSIVGMKSITAEGTKKALAAKCLMASQETRLPKKLKAPPTKTYHNVPVQDRSFHYGVESSGMPIVAAHHALLRQEESMFIPGVDPFPSPTRRFELGYCDGHPLRLSPPSGVHHLVSSTIHEALSECDARNRHTLLGYVLPAPSSLRTHNLNIVPRFDGPEPGMAYYSQSIISSINDFHGAYERVLSSISTKQD